MYNIQIITFGREICFARNPKCEECFLTKYCSYHKEQEKGSRKKGKKEQATTTLGSWKIFPRITFAVFLPTPAREVNASRSSGTRLSYFSTKSLQQAMIFFAE